MAHDGATKESAQPLRVFVIEDHPVVRQGLKDFIDHEDDMTVCGEAENALDGIRALKERDVDVAVVDLMLPDKGGLELIADIRERCPDVAVLVLTAREETLYAERALRAGARGYMMKGQGLNKIAEGIRCVQRGDIYLSESMANRMLERYIGRDSTTSGSTVAALSDRELQVFECIGKGLSTRDIAEKLHLSVKTVESYRARIKTKLNLENATELMVHAVKWVENEHSGIY